MNDIQSYINNALSEPNFVFISQLALKGLSVIGFVPDMQTSEHISWERKVTQHTVENGARLSDHITQGLITIDQKYIVTILTPNVISGTSVITPIVWVLNELRNSQELCTVFTSYHIYKNMIIKSLTIDKVDDVYNTVECHITFQELNIEDLSNAYISSSNIVEKTKKTADRLFNAASSFEQNISNLVATPVGEIYGLF